MPTVFGTNGADLLYGSDDDDAIYASGGNDVIYGEAGADDIFGGSGSDLIFGGDGADDISGGSGNDTVRYDDSSEGVVVSLNTGQGFNGTAEGDTLSGIEHLAGSSYADTLYGDGGINSLSGYAGDDTLHGGGGADNLVGDPGNDTLKGGGGADALNGGSGADTADYWASSEGVFVSLINGSGAGGDAEGDQLDSIERVSGSAHDDLLWGDDGAFNILRGNDGNDTLKGFGGADNLFGGDGNDTLHGMDGADALRGEDGVDTLYGGADRDYLYGGNNADVFRWDETNETGLTELTADRVWDFNRLEGDEFNLSAIDADVYAAGNQAFAFIGTDAFSGTPGEIRYYHSGGNTYLEMQTGTSVDVEGVIMLAGIHDPEANWFLL